MRTVQTLLEREKEDGKDDDDGADDHNDDDGRSLECNPLQRRNIF